MPAVIRIGDPISCGDTMAQGSGNVFANGIPISRKGVDLTAGHCFPPVPIISTRENSSVYANNILIDRIGDPISVHCCGNSCHGGNALNGSPDVFANDGGGGPDSVNVTVEKYVQPNVNKLKAAHILADDPQVAPQFQEYRRVQEAKVNFKPQPTPPVVEVAPPPKSQPAKVPSDCSDIMSHEGKFPGSFRLSPNYVLSQLTTNTAVSNYPLRANAGLSEKEIVCNLRVFCLNVLEPVLAKYGSNLTINSAFRYDASSQHGKGQAVDVSFKNLANEQGWWDRANDLKESFSYDQLIYEACPGAVWYHLSYTSGNNRRMTLTKPRHNNTYLAGIQRVIS